MAPPTQIVYNLLNIVESKHSTVQWSSLLQFLDQLTSDITTCFLVSLYNVSHTSNEIHNYHFLLHSYMLLYMELATSEDCYKKWCCNVCWCGGYLWRSTTCMTSSTTAFGRPNRSFAMTTSNGGLGFIHLIWSLFIFKCLLPCYFFLKSHLPKKYLLNIIIKLKQTDIIDYLHWKLI